jgi:hypothetical protein
MSIKRRAFPSRGSYVARRWITLDRGTVKMARICIRLGATYNLVPAVP